MTTPVIRVEGLSKRYRIGRKEEQADTFIGAFSSFLKAPFSNFKRVRELSTFNGNGSADDVIWALKDVFFDVQEGEVLGIIGRNGAGKSTLLKILSRITEPTSGRIEIQGRVSSLLEVGTGFHSDLTGRENIFLNGAILGMTAAEIKKKFDEIVDFSGVEKFIDTPVKRYSSGMIIRLAFAVAAHLEPEILIIDEVLAVGDAEFQKKCLGKMQAVAKGGRTVLFVSHNMAAVQTLCTRGIVLNGGKVKCDTNAFEAVCQHLSNIEKSAQIDMAKRVDRGGTGTCRIVSCRVLDDRGEATTHLQVGEASTFLFELNRPISQPTLDFAFYDMNGNLVADFNSHIYSDQDRLNSGPCRSIQCTVDPVLLAPGQYRINVSLYGGSTLTDDVEGAVVVHVSDGALCGRPVSSQTRGVAVFPHRWSFETITSVV